MITFPQRSWGMPALLAVLIQLPPSLHAQPGLQRAGRVVEARVDDARVVAALVGGELGLPLEHADRRSRTAVDQLAGDRQADDPAPDDGEVAALGRSRGCPGELDTRPG